MPLVTIKLNESGIKKLEELQFNLLNRIGKDIKDEAQYLCPVRTGALRDSIYNYTNELEKSTVVGTNKEYAIFVEMGTRFQSAQPFLRPALDNIMSNLEQI